MKFKKIIILLIVIAIISINSQCDAKYVIEYTKKAVEITIINT